MRLKVGVGANKKIKFFICIKYRFKTPKIVHVTYFLVPMGAATQHVYVACISVRMHKSSHKIPGKLEVRLSYNLVKKKDTKD